MTTTNRARYFLGLCAALCFGLCLLAPAQAATLQRQALIAALRHGGYVIVMRHASSPMIRPDRAHAARGNADLERQLDKTGRSSARAMGRAFRRLGIPVGRILSSPAYRARETARLAGFGVPVTRPQLAESEKGMAGGVSQTKAEWLRAQTGRKPRPGTNTLIVTHTPNLRAAFGGDAKDTSAGEALVFRPVRRSTGQLVAHVKIDQWPVLTRH